MKCPVCQNYNYKEIETIKTSKLTGSLIYENIIIVQCSNCQHVFNVLEQNDLEKLKEFYKYEYIDQKFTITFPQILNSLDYNINQDKSYFNVDNNKNEKKFIISQKNINTFVKNLFSINDKKQSSDCLYSLPLLDFISLEQFLEHCWNLENVISFLNKFISEKGIIHISVPDYSRYKKYENNDKISYFLLIKEHIQHFTPESLIFLFDKYGFSVKEQIQNFYPILNNKLKIPNIEISFTRKDKVIKDGIFCYGIGKEFFYLIENSIFFDDLILSGLIDDTPAKRGATVKGLEIFSSDIIPSLTDKSEIIITALFGIKEIKEKIISLGFKGKITELQTNIIETA